MDSRLIQSAKQLNKRRHRRRVWTRILLVLSCAVALGTIYVMSLPAVTQEKDIFCGIETHEHTAECYTKLVEETTPELICALQEAEAHVHSEACYEIQVLHEHGDDCYEVVEGHIHEDACYELTDESKTLVCTLEEAEAEQILICTEEIGETSKLICVLEELEGHIHAEECFREMEVDLLTCEFEETEEHKHTELCYGYWELACQKEVHEHSLICYSNPNADVETASQWEKTFHEVGITGLHREDLLNIARTQLGYRESTRNYIVRDDGTTIDGYTRYGHWYGNIYGEWCAMFASFCLEYAEVSDVPYHAACQAWINALKELDLYTDGVEVPLPGYLIFFDWADGARYKAQHVGVVLTQRDGMIYTIEGNSNGVVAIRKYAADDPEILGFGILDWK